jgi:hypothetical protein
MSFLDLTGFPGTLPVDRESLVCTFCGKKPVVGYTFAVDAEIDAAGEVASREFVADSIIATCGEHAPILQEQFEKDVRNADAVLGPEDEGHG